MRNNRHDGGRIPVKAVAARTSGVPCVEKSFAGIPYTDAAIGDVYALVLVGVHDVPLAGGAAVGNDVHIATTTGALSVTARGTAGASGTRLLGRVVAVPDDPGPTFGPPANRMFILLTPQTAVPVA